MKKLIFLLAAIVVVLALTNPNEADYREHIRQQQGIAGSMGMAVADLITGGKKVASSVITSPLAAASTSVATASFHAKI